MRYRRSGRPDHLIPNSRAERLSSAHLPVGRRPSVRVRNGVVRWQRRPDSERNISISPSDMQTSKQIASAVHLSFDR